MAKTGKPGVMIYFETARAIKRCSYEEKGRLFDAILEYAEFGVVPELPPPLDMAWAFISERIDSDSARYADIQEKNRMKGIISDFKRNYAPVHGIDPENKAALAEYIKQRTQADNGQPLLTVADSGRPIQPTTTQLQHNTSPYPTTEECLMDNRKMVYGPAQNEKKTDDMTFNDKRRKAIVKLETYGG